MTTFMHKSIAIVAALSSITFAAPLAAPLRNRQSTDGVCVDGKTKVFMPELYNVYYYPGVAPFPSRATTINVFNEGRDGGSAQDQVVRWSNLPSGIENCTIGYSQAAERAFSVFDNGLVRFAQLSSLPSPVTSETVPGVAIDGAQRGALDFTSWPQTTGAAGHIGGPVDCGAEVVVRMYKDMSASGGAGSVTLEQDSTNGFWLEHSC